MYLEIALSNILG